MAVILQQSKSVFHPRPLPSSFFIFLFLGFGLIFSVPPPAQAKDMSGRVGIGFINEFSNSSLFKEVPALSVKYGLSKDLAALGAVGVHTQSPGGFTLGAKLFKNIFYETNLNFYGALGAGLIKSDKTGLELLALFGTEVFIPGLESLGLSFEAGASVSNITGDVVLKTVGYTFLHAGVHFYF